MIKTTRDRFTSGQASKATKVSFHNVDYWAASGLIPPSVEEADGPATCRVYNFPDLMALAVARELRSSGVNLKSAKAIIDYVRKRKNYEKIDGKTIFLIQNADGTVIEKHPSEVVNSLRTRGCTCVIDLGAIFQELNIAVKTLPRPQRGQAHLVTQESQDGHGKDQRKQKALS